jgi:hypothetical protein
MILATLALIGCASMPLDLPGTTEAPSPARPDAATPPSPDLATAPPNACVAAGGACVYGDLVPVHCAEGTHIAVQIQTAHPEACALGICCEPGPAPSCTTFDTPQACTIAGCTWNDCTAGDCARDGYCVDPDCRVTGCPNPGDKCEPCWSGYACQGASGVC